MNPSAMTSMAVPKVLQGIVKATGERVWIPTSGRRPYWTDRGPRAIDLTDEEMARYFPRWLEWLEEVSKFRRTQSR